MSLNRIAKNVLCYGIMGCCLTNCFKPPYNNFRPDSPTTRKAAQGAGIVGITGGVVSGTMAGVLAGGAIGGLVGGAVGLSKETKKSIVKELQNQNIQYVEYGDTITLIVPTDKYFVFNSPRLNEVCYPGLNNIAKLIKLYPPTPVYVAGFTDNVGSSQHKQKMSQAQAETMMSYLWAQGVASQRLKAEGYGDKNDIADNSIIHGSAMNRRIEIQWFTHQMGATGQVMPARYIATK